MTESGLTWTVQAGVVLMAIAVAVQTLVLLGAALAGRRLLSRIAALEAELRASAGPTLASLARVAENAEEVSERLARGLPQLEEAIEGAAANVRRANQIFEMLESGLLAPLRPIARGMEIWRRLRGRPAPPPVPLLGPDSPP